MIIVLDCNIWISLTLNHQIDFIVEMADKGIKIPSCETLRDEIAEVLSRPKISKFIDKSSVNKVIHLHDLITKRYIPGEIPDIVSDKKDNYLFALCLKANADYFVTGDKLLINENTYRDTRIISLSALKELIKE